MKTKINVSVFCIAGFASLFFLAPSGAVLAYAPSISGISTENIMGSGGQIKWTTDIASDSKVYYGTSSGNLNYPSENRCDAGGNVISHCINLMNLAYSTVYYYKVSSCYGAECSESSIQQFTSASDSGGVSYSGGSSTGGGSSSGGGGSGTTNTGGAINGQIKDNSGVGVPNVFLNIYKADNSASYGGQTNLQGFYDISGIPGGSYKIGIFLSETSGFVAPPPVDINIAFGQTLTQNFTLIKAQKTIKGRVNAENGSLVDAYVSAFRKETQSHVQGRTDSKGEYKLLLTGGSWEISVYPAIQLTGWVYNQPPQTVVFSESAGTEEKIVDFIVTIADSTVKGKVLMPDGFPPAANTVSISFMNESSFGFGAYPDSGGAFIIKLPAGSYRVFVASQDSTVSSPQIAPLSLASGETKDLGTIALIKAQKTIKGRVTRNDGSGVGDAYVNAFRKSTESSVQTQTDSSGNYTLLVTGGFWEVSTFSMSQSADWVSNQPPQTALFADNTNPEEKIMNFSVIFTDAKVNGRILRPDGSSPSAGSVSVNFQPLSGNGFGGNVDDSGFFSVPLPSGTYNIFIQSNDSTFSAPAVLPVTLSKGETKDLGTITLIKAQKTIKGKVTRGDGSAITNASVNVYRQSPQGYAQANTDSSGNFSIFVTGGVWEVNVFPLVPSADWAYNQAPQSVVFANDLVFEEAAVNFTVLTADATVQGKILKPDGSVPPQNMVFIGFQKSDGGYGFGGSIDSAGLFSVRLPADSYNVMVGSQDNAFTGPTLAPITLSKGEVKDLGTIRLIQATKFLRGKILRPDGRAVNDSMVTAFQKETQRWLEARPDSSGSYTLSLLGGSWEISLKPSYSSVDWVYTKAPSSIVFKNDTTVEEQTMDFAVTFANAAFRGKVLMPDGSPPLPNTIFGGFRSSEGFEFGGPIDASGSFLVQAVAGTYSVLIHSSDPKISAPSLPPVNIASGETKDLGEIKLILKKDHIKGRVTNKDGKGISGVFIDAYQPSGGGYAGAKTDLNGVFDILVTPGTWEVIAKPDSSLKLFSGEPPRRVTVASGVTAEVNFVLILADATLSGRVTDAVGNLLSDVFGFLNLSQYADLGQGFGGSVERGVFSIPIPSGTYTVSLFMPPDFPYTPGPAQTVKVEAEKTTEIKIAVSKHTSSVSGTIKEESGKAVTGFDANVFATTKEGTWKEAFFDKVTGKYVLNLSAGTWYLGYRIDPASGFISAHEPALEVSVKEGEKVIKDLVVKKAGSSVFGNVSDPAGKGIAHVFIAVSKASFGAAAEAGREEAFRDIFVSGGETDENGFYKIVLPAGSYFIKSFVHPESGLINAKEAKIDLAEGDSKEVNFRLQQATLKITGKILIEEAAAPNSFVSSWSPEGGYQESFSRADGAYQLNVTASSTWRVTASKELNGELYKSSETSVAVGESDIMLNIMLKKVSSLPPPVVKSADATKTTVVNVPDGPTVVASANAVASSGSVSISIAPDVRAASQGEVKVVGVAYNLEARDAGGQIVSSFSAPVTIRMPYSENDVKDLGVRESELAVGFWDETVATWKPLESCVVNEAENTVTCSTSHFTRFAIVAATDVTPPVPPAGAKAEAIGKNGLIKLSWVNPTKDFDHAKIYKSIKKGELGEVIFAEVKENTKVDSGLLDGETYYYTIRSVDPAGNESANTDQVSAKSVGTSDKLKEKEVKALFLSTSGRGSKGNEVSALQKILIAEGFLAEELGTGFFGPATEAALKKFQAKFGLESVGFVGAKTKAKLNELSGASFSTSTKSILATTTVATTILRNRSQGASGDDIKTLQELLIKENVYPEGLITGFFGGLTKRAVIRFQEKYSDEILAPVGLQKGTGFIGPSTLKKINALLRND